MFVCCEEIIVVLIVDWMIVNVIFDYVVILCECFDVVCLNGWICFLVVFYGEDLVIIYRVIVR